MRESNIKKSAGIIRDVESFNAALEKIEKVDHLAVDTETEGLEIWNNHKLCGIGVYLPTGEGFYFPFRHKQPELPLFEGMGGDGPNLPLSLLPRLLKSLHSPKTLIGHNIKFDLAVMYQDGFEVLPTQELEDTVTAARLFFPDKYQSLSLEAVSDAILHTDSENWKKEFKAYLKKNKWTKNYDFAPPEELGPYCITDCENTLKIRDFLYKFIVETGQDRVWEQEKALLQVLWQMEKEGLFFDRAYCEDRLEKLHAKLGQLEQIIYKLVGYEFDIRSPKQVNEVMVKLGISSPHLTPGGKPKWGVAELMTVSHPIAAMILEYRGIEKMRSTYFEPLPQWVDDRLHPSFKPSGAVTGRMSCSNPSLMNLSNKSQDLAGEESNPEVADAIKAMLGAREGQNVDMTSASGSIAGGGSYASLISYAKTYEDTDTSIAVRRLYIPPPGYFLYCIDYSQMEMRVFADYVNDENLNKLLETGEDFHSIVAKEVWGVKEDSSLWKFYRNLAKAINFGLIYGIGNDKLSSQIQKTVEEAIVYKKEYFSRFPKALKFIHQVRDVVISRGYVTNRFGRRYVLVPDKSYVGVNYLCQGTAADIVKNRMIAVHEYLKGKQTKMVVQVHDELIFYVKEEEEMEVVPKLKEILEERQIQMYLPTEVSKGHPSWAEKVKWCTSCMHSKEECECQSQNS